MGMGARRQLIRSLEIARGLSAKTPSESSNIRGPHYPAVDIMF